MSDSWLSSDQAMALQRLFDIKGSWKDLIELNEAIERVQLAFKDSDGWVKDPDKVLLISENQRLTALVETRENQLSMVQTDLEATTKNEAELFKRCCELEDSNKRLSAGFQILREVTVEAIEAVAPKSFWERAVDRLRSWVWR